MHNLWLNAWRACISSLDSEQMTRPSFVMCILSGVKILYWVSRTNGKSRFSLLFMGSTVSRRVPWLIPSFLYVFVLFLLILVSQTKIFLFPKQQRGVEFVHNPSLQRSKGMPFLRNTSSSEVGLLVGSRQRLNSWFLLILSTNSVLSRAYYFHGVPNIIDFLLYLCVVGNGDNLPLPFLCHTLVETKQQSSKRAALVVWF